MTHVAGEQLAAYWLGELDAPSSAQLEEHVFACDGCAEAWTNTSRVIAAVRALIPSVISSARLTDLRARRPALKQAVVAPGQAATVRFDPGDDLFVLELQADLAGAERVDFSIEVPGGPTLIELPSAPFDRERGTVLVACQRHFMRPGFPTLVQMRVRAIHDGGSREAGVYTIDHVLCV